MFEELKKNELKKKPVYITKAEIVEKLKGVNEKDVRTFINEVLIEHKMNIRKWSVPYVIFEMAKEYFGSLPKKIHNNGYK